MHDAEHDRESEAGALADFLRREERFEDARLRLLVHAVAGIADGEHDVGPGIHLAVGGHKRFVANREVSLESQFSATLHCIARVDHHVHDDLLELSRIDVHLTRFGRQPRHDLDVFAHDASCEFLDAGHRFVDVDALDFRRPLAAEREQLLGELG
jgi:hypothetical protein